MTDTATAPAMITVPAAQGALTASPASNNAPATTPGYKTSEFYLKLLALLISYVMASGVVTNNTLLQVITIGSTILASLGYTAARTSLKIAAMRAVKVASVALMLCIFVLAGCGGAAGALHTGVITVEACGKADAGPLLNSVFQLITQNAANLEAALTSLAGVIGVDAVKCLIAAVDAMLSPPSGSAATAAPSPGLIRARAWAASAK